MNVLIDENSIQSRITEMAQEIDSYYKQQDWYRRTQEPIIVIGVLTGALFFMADLVRKLSIRTKLDFIRVSTYPGKMTTAQESKIIAEPVARLHDAHILLVDDILDTGNTITTVKTHLSLPYPEDIRTAVLLRKPYWRKKRHEKSYDDIMGDFVGFDIPDEFVVGYGLDYNDKYCERPYINVLEGETNEFRTSKSKAE